MTGPPLACDLARWSMITGVSGYWVHIRSTSGRSSGSMRKLMARLCSAPASNILAYPGWSIHRGPSLIPGRADLPRTLKAYMPPLERATIAFPWSASVMSLTAGTIPVPQKRSGSFAMTFRM